MPGPFNVVERIFKESSDILRRFTVHNIYNIEPLVYLPRNSQGIIYVQLQVDFRILATIWLSLVVESLVWSFIFVLDCKNNSNSSLAKEHCHYFVIIFLFLTAVSITSYVTAIFEMKIETFKDGLAE